MGRVLRVCYNSGSEYFNYLLAIIKYRGSMETTAVAMNKDVLDRFYCLYTSFINRRGFCRGNRGSIKSIIGRWEWSDFLLTLKYIGSGDIGRNYLLHEGYEDYGWYPSVVCHDTRDESYVVVVTNDWLEHGRYPTLDLAVSVARLYGGEVTDTISYDEWITLDEEGMQ